MWADIGCCLGIAYDLAAVRFGSLLPAAAAAAASAGQG